MRSTVSNKPSGLSLAELMVAVGFFAVAILAILGLTVSVLRTDSKSSESAAGALMADRLLQRTIARVKGDATARANFWNNEHLTPPWEQGVARSTSGNDFNYVIYATTVVGVGGSPVGSLAPDNRLKKVDVLVWWFNANPTDRAGYGKLNTRVTQLVSEAETVAPP